MRRSQQKGGTDHRSEVPRLSKCGRLKTLLESITTRAWRYRHDSVIFP